MNYTLAHINELLTFLSEDERKRLPAVIRRLMSSEDFRLLFRHMNQTCGGLHTSVFSGHTDTIKAASLDGARAHVRELFDTYISTFTEKVERPTEQDTEPKP